MAIPIRILLLIATLLTMHASKICGQVSTEDRHFPVIVDPAKLPKGALMRIGQFGDRTTFMGVYLIRFSPDGKYVAIRPRDHIVRVFDLGSGQKVCEVDGHENIVKGLEFAPDSKSFATLGFGEIESVILWDTKTGKEIKRFAYGGDDMAFVESGKYIHVMREQRLDRITVADGTTKQLLRWPRSERAVGLSRDGMSVASSLQQQTRASPIYINTYLGANRTTRFGVSALTTSAAQVEFSQFKTWFLARFSHQRQVYLWEGERPKNRKELGVHESDVYSVSTSHDDRYFLTTAKNGSAFLWDSISKTHIHKIEGHDETANIVASEFSPDGTLFATGASGRKDSSMIIWDLKKVVFPDIGKKEEPLDEAATEANWKALSDASAKKANDAITQFVNHGDLQTDRFSARIKKLTNIVDSTKIDEYIKKLDSNNYSERANATESLLKLRNVAEPKLKRELRITDSVEVRWRIDLILKTPITKPKIAEADFRRLRRLIHALELTANDTAVELLDNLSQGHPHIDVAREATQALIRTKAARLRQKPAN